MAGRFAPIGWEMRWSRQRRLLIQPVVSFLLAWQGLQGWTSDALAQSLHFTRLRSSSATCAEAQSSVQSELKARGYFVPIRDRSDPRRDRMIFPAMTIDSTSIGLDYYDVPQGRKQQLDVHLSGDSDRLYQGLLSSPTFLSSLGALIMEACSDIGLVSFQHWFEGAVPVGYFPDGTARTFQWVDLADGPHVRRVSGPDGATVIQFEWGYYFSP